LPAKRTGTPLACPRLPSRCMQPAARGTIPMPRKTFGQDRPVPLLKQPGLRNRYNLRQHPPVVKLSGWPPTSLPAHALRLEINLSEFGLMYRFRRFDRMVSGWSQVDQLIDAASPGSTGRPWVDGTSMRPFPTVGVISFPDCSNATFDEKLEHAPENGLFYRDWRNCSKSLCIFRKSGGLRYIMCPDAYSA
jgi:hypothetical protein